MDAKSVVTIELFGAQRAIAGVDSINMPVRKGTAAKDVIRFLSSHFPELDLDDKRLLLVVNHEVASPDRLIEANDTVCLIPQIAGG